MQVKHIVMWKVAGNSPADKHASNLRVKSAFESLLHEIPGLQELEVGIDTSQVDYAFNVVLYSVFESAEALAAYATHPAHLKVRDELAGLRVERCQVDYEAP